MTRKSKRELSRQLDGIETETAAGSVDLTAQQAAAIRAVDRYHWQCECDWGVSIPWTPAFIDEALAAIDDDLTAAWYEVFQ